LLSEDFLQDKNQQCFFFLFIVRLSNKCEYITSQRLNGQKIFREWKNKDRDVLWDPSMVAFTVERILSWVPIVGILSHAFNRFCTYMVQFNSVSFYIQASCQVVFRLGKEVIPLDLCVLIKPNHLYYWWRNTTTCTYPGKGMLNKFSTLSFSFLLYGLSENRGRIQRKTLWKGPYAIVDYNPTIWSLQCRLQHIYHGQPYARVDLNPMPESTLSSSQGLRIWSQCCSLRQLYFISFSLKWGDIFTVMSTYLKMWRKSSQATDIQLYR
jgi:hypothetical protein